MNPGYDADHLDYRRKSIEMLLLRFTGNEAISSLLARASSFFAAQFPRGSTASDVTDPAALTFKAPTPETHSMRSENPS